MKKHIICAVLGISAMAAHAQAADKPVFTCQTDETVIKVYADPAKGKSNNAKTFTYKEWSLPSEDWIKERGVSKEDVLKDEKPFREMTGGKYLWNGANGRHCRASNLAFIHPTGNRAFILIPADQQGCGPLEMHFTKYGSLEVWIWGSKMPKGKEIDTLNDLLHSDDKFIFHCKKPKY